MSRFWALLIQPEPLGPIPAALRPALGVVALILRLFVAGLTGFLLSTIRLGDVPVLGVTGFIPYGFDKLLGDNARFAMGPDMFQAIGMPFPEVTALLVGMLELFGGLAILFGLLTRPFALALAGSMVVALIKVNNWPEELPLLVASLLLVWLGGGVFSLDGIVAKRTAPAPRAQLATGPNR